MYIIGGVSLFLFAFSYLSLRVLSQISLPDANIKLTFKEGVTAKEIIIILKEKGFNIDENKFLSQEGYLFPDTYKFHPAAGSDQILKQMLDNFFAQAGNVDYQDLIMASIIQKEESSAEEMPKIAGVFYNRLAKNIRLQADSTVNYVTGKSMPQALITDTKIADPYNTYQIYGLPPAPISNPGLDAIGAAQNPKNHNYLYFLHAQSGKAIYAQTFSEHKQNKEKHL